MVFLPLWIMEKNNAHIGTGKKGEALAQNYVVQNGYLILETNWRHSHAEVDIIASKNQTLYFFEVKTRRSKLFGLPETSVGTKKMNKLKEAAEHYLHQNPKWKWLQFNILSIVLLKNMQPEFLLIEDVF